MTGSARASDLLIRALEPADSIAELTELLHRAYAGLAARGLRYLATHQDTDTTIRRIRGGECLLAIVDGRTAGTITWHGPHEGGGHDWYNRPDVATFHQFCVDPPFQGRRIASTLLTEVERRAREAGAAELAADTAEGARDLIAWYERRGYRKVGEADWRPVTNYGSVILSKGLSVPVHPQER